MTHASQFRKQCSAWGWALGALLTAGVAGAAPLLPLHTGDINDDGVRNVADISCFIEAAIANSQPLSNPVCQAYADADVDLQCDGLINVTDVQRSVLLVLSTVSGDTALEALLRNQDKDLDLLHDACDSDADGDGFPNDCELANESDPLDPTSIPADSNACGCPGGCVIDGDCIANGATNPDNECEFCNPDLDAGAYSPISEAECDDGSVCTTGDFCVEGTCIGSPVICNDGNACTDDSCNPLTGCVTTFNTATCNDGNACTSGDVCGGGTCAGTAITCNDGNACTTDSCNPASGCQTAPITCNDGIACTTDSCNPSTGCVATANNASCNDNNPCTNDVCNLTAGCQNPNNTATCNDGNACTSGDVCGGGTCAGTAITCNDGNACTTDSCNPASGCQTAPITCNDGIACTTDSCNPSTGCVATANNASCNDNNPCTNDVCNLTAGCQNPNNTATCNDGNACTSGDVCGGGTCAGTAITCNDGNACTTDSCNPASGCQTAPITCNDGIACTTDSCNPSTGCVATANNASCNDNNPCTNDVCNLTAGCQNPNNTATCNDGNACTQTDTCQGGACVGGNPVVCPSNLHPDCNAGACNPSTGLCSLPNGTPCDDEDVCTVNDACVAGDCQATALPCQEALCVISGKAGDTVSCPFNLGRSAAAMPPAVGIQFKLNYDVARVTLQHFDDGLFCPIPGAPPEFCFPYTLPPFVQLQSGHSVSLVPQSFPEWDVPGAAHEALLINISSPAPLTDAVVAPGGILVSGDPVMFGMVFTLDVDIPATNPVIVDVLNLAATDADAGFLPTAVDNFYVISSP